MRRNVCLLKLLNHDQIWLHGQIQFRSATGLLKKDWSTTSSFSLPLCISGSYSTCLYLSQSFLCLPFMSSLFHYLIFPHLSHIPSFFSTSTHQCISSFLYSVSFLSFFLIASLFTFHSQHIFPSLHLSVSLFLSRIPQCILLFGIFLSLYFIASLILPISHSPLLWFSVLFHYFHIHLSPLLSILCALAFPLSHVSTVS